MDRAVHWFRRDLRLDDHQALAAALASARGVIGLFVLEPEIAAGRDSPARVHFLAGSLRALDAALRVRGSRLVVRTGDPLHVVPAFAAEAGAGLVTAVRDAEPRARRRDLLVEKALTAHGRRFLMTDEQWLAPVPEMPEAKVFGAFHRWITARLPRAGRPLPAPPRGFVEARGLPASDALPEARALAGQLEGSIPDAGEPAGQLRLARFVAERLTAYPRARHRLDAAGTSGLSPDLRFGTVSVRRVLAEVAGRPGSEHFTRELAWRDFYAAVLWQRPEVLMRAFRPAFDGLRWDRDESRLNAWREGRTGFPLVDAAMRQLRAEHWIPNRARMVVASFLCKDLHLDWRLGEQHFMTQLVDGDAASNNGGWQWSASTGTDAQPYFRIFNPELQRERFDPNLEYVRRWVPEFRSAAYPAPIVDHARERRRALGEYRAAAGR